MSKKVLTEECLRATERYDFERETRGNQDDPRLLNCGMERGRRHEPVWRRNQHACWQVCAHCEYRLRYVPKKEAHGLRRASGPLPRDVETGRWQPTVKAAGTASSSRRTEAGPPSPGSPGPAAKPAARRTTSASKRRARDDLSMVGSDAQSEEVSKLREDVKNTQAMLQQVLLRLDTAAATPTTVPSPETAPATEPTRAGSLTEAAEKPPVGSQNVSEAKPQGADDDPQS